MRSTDVVVAPPFVYIDQVKTSITDRIEISGQNSWVGKGGAFTGEIRLAFSSLSKVLVFLFLMLRVRPVGCLRILFFCIFSHSCASCFLDVSLCLSSLYYYFLVLFYYAAI